MKQPLTRWLIFGLCLIILLASMGWTTVHLLKMERERFRADQDAEVQERIRLALWRIDSLVSALLIRENARPVEHFQAFHAADQIYTRMYQEVPSGEVLAPSPLLTERPPHVRLFFEHRAETGLTSPQVPTGNQRDLAEANYTDGEQIRMSSAELEKVRPWIDGVLAAAREHCEKSGAGITGIRKAKTGTAENPWAANESRSQAVINTMELQKRSAVVQQSQLSQNVAVAPRKKASALAANAEIQEEGLSAAKSKADASAAGGAPPKAEVETIRISRFAPVWSQENLFLVRLITPDGDGEAEPLAQGVWLDWPGLKEELESEAGDLFPAAVLEPVDRAEPEPAGDSNRLASIPATLRTGEVVIPVSIALLGTPLRRSLLVAWGCILAAAFAVAALLYGAITLGERRGAFVSAVTHELRTPLTTFQLYTDLLAQGVAGDDKEKTSQYLDTLRGESERLGHLVENVLAYAQLERGRGRRQADTVSLGDLVEQVRERLARRAAQSDMELVTDISPEALKRKVKVDPGAVEQILYNLVDNACKYGQPDSENGDGERRIHLEAKVSGPMALLRVRDHGRGVPRKESRRLFRPFQKSAEDAAHSAPGVGLGLALCRKMSEALGGKLKLEEAGTGASFVLELPVAAV